MALVPVQEVTVARYDPCIRKIAGYQEPAKVKGWLTKSSTDKNVPWVLRVLPEHVDEVKNAFPGVLDVIKGSRNVGCVNGTALLSTSFKVYTVGGVERPEFMYRAIHGGQPHQGIKSRLGRGSDPIFLHIHLRKHLRWACREPSPFLSVTQVQRKVCRVACEYEMRGYSGIRIIKFRTSGPGWDHAVQRMWRARALLRLLGMRMDDRPYIDNEFLIEASIPAESIVAQYNWRDFDLYGRIEADALAELARKQRRAEVLKKRRAARKKKAEEAAKKRKAEGEGEDGDSRKTIKRLKIGDRWAAT